MSKAEGTVADVIENKAKWATIVGDSREKATDIHDGAVQMVVTSPLYFGLRDYGAAGQIGQEKTPREFVEALVGVMREVRRVLADDGTLWLNIGDSYAGSGSVSGVGYDGHAGDVGSRARWAKGAGKGIGDKRHHPPDGLKPKDLYGIPWRVALALQGFAVTPFSSFSAWADELSEARERGDWDAVGAVECKLRNVDLLAGLSASGWYLRSDIVWAKPNPMPESVADRPTRSHEYVFLLSKRARYFYDGAAIREQGTNRAPGNVTHKQTDAAINRTKTGLCKIGAAETRNARDVWTITPESFDGAHFATMSPELARKCILAGSRKGDIVYDPFGGAATTALVALQEGRRAIMRELNPEYVELQRKRLATFDADASTPILARNADFGPLFGGEK